MPERASLPLRTCRLGRVDYVETARLQRSLRAAREAGAVEDLLLLVEHEPVITCGTRTEAGEVAHARTTGVPLVPVERGGKATWHGPGQVVAYPIMGIDVVEGDVRQLVRLLEQSIIDTLLEHGVVSDRRPGYPGVWVEPTAPQPRKVASVGLRLTRGVTFHGMAVNVDCDLEPFTWFTPCGIADARMTSVARELERAGTATSPTLLDDVRESLAAAVARNFGLVPRPVDPHELAAAARLHPAPDPDVSLPRPPQVRGATRVPLGAGAAS